MSQPKQNPFAVFATNSDTAFEEFSITLDNGATLTGIAHIPTGGIYHSSPHKPLMVGLHGGSCTAYTYDASPDYTASIYSSLTGVPFVAFHRPNVCGSSGWLREQQRFAPPADSVSYFEHEAAWFDEFIFPALWKHFGKPHGCASIVTTSHSMAVIPTIIAAGSYSENSQTRAYPWSGIVLSGLGEVPTETMMKHHREDTMWQQEDVPFGNDDQIHVGPFTRANKLALMLGPPGAVDAKLVDLLWKQNAPFLLAELIDLNGMWIAKKSEYKAKVKLPVLYAIGTMDWLWQSKREHVDLFTGGFVNAPRVEGATIPNAPHAIEWSPMASAWWLRVIGWAMEVTTAEGMNSRRLVAFE